MNGYPEPQGGGWKIPTLFGITIALLGANVYSFLQIDQMKTQMLAMREGILGELSTVKETNSLSAQASQKNVESLRNQLAAARSAASQAAGQAREEAQAHADQLSAKLAQEQRRLEDQTKQAITQVSAETAAVSSKVGAVSTEVGAVKEDVANTKAELDKTVAGLSRAVGDLGVQSGLIATNSSELKALKELGDRNYFEFKLSKTKQPYKIADITLLLKKTDAKKNRYTLEVVADDKTFERKDKFVLEPVQFYMSRYKQPYELVINQVGKDQISGYLAQPKVQVARN
jgi:hypothetical protein